MVTRLRKVITAIDVDGRAFAELHRETQVDKRWYPDDPVPLDMESAEAAEWIGQFNAAALAENLQLKAELLALTSEQVSAVETLRQEHAANVVHLNEQIATLTAELAAVTADRDDWRARVPPDKAPREVTTRELLARVMTFAPDAIKKIWTSDADVATVATKTLFNRDGGVDLNSEAMSQLFSGLVEADLLTPAEAEAILT